MTIRTYCEVAALSASPHQRLMLTEAHGKNGCLLGRSYHLPLPSTLMSLWGIFQPSFSYFYFLSSFPFIRFALRHKGVIVTVILLAWQNFGHFEKHRRWEERGIRRRNWRLWEICAFRAPQGSIWNLTSLCSSHYSEDLSAQWRTHPLVDYRTELSTTMLYMHI